MNRLIGAVGSDVMTGFGVCKQRDARGRLATFNVTLGLYCMGRVIN